RRVRWLGGRGACCAPGRLRPRPAGLTADASGGTTMYNIRTSAETVIARPIEVVQSQFADMAHHASVGVHASLEVDNVRPTQEGCLFTGRRRVLGRLQEDEMELRRDPDGGSVLRSLAGAN